MKMTTKVQAALVCFCVMGACGGTTPTTSADAAPSCGDDPRAQIYEPGMTATATDGITVSLRAAMPSPPERLGNIWSLEVRDADGVPLDVDSLQVSSFMPDHGHGARIASSPEAGASIGVFDTESFDLWMPGIWEVKFLVRHAAASSSALLTFCIEE